MQTMFGIRRLSFFLAVLSTLLLASKGFSEQLFTCRKVSNGQLVITNRPTESSNSRCLRYIYRRNSFNKVSKKGFEAFKPDPSKSVLKAALKKDSKAQGVRASNSSDPEKKRKYLQLRSELMALVK